MPTPTLNTKIAIDGEKEYKQAVSEINSGLKVLRSEMKLTSTAFAENSKSVEALTAKGDVLERQILSQKEKISTLEDALKNSAQAYGESDRKTQAWQVSLNRAQEELIQMERSLRDNRAELQEATEAARTADQAYDDMSDAMGQNADAADENQSVMGKLRGLLGDTSGDTKNLGGNILDLAGKLGVNLPEGVTKALGSTGKLAGGLGAAVGVATALAIAIGKIEQKLIALTKDRASAATNISRVAQTINMNVEATQKWDYVLKTVGSDINSAQGDLSAFQEKIQDAGNGTGEAAELFAAMGISVRDNVTGELRSTEDVLLDTIHHLQTMTDVTERNATSSKLLGGTGEALIPIYNQSAESLDFLLQKKEELGLLTGEEIERLKDVSESLLDYEERINAANDAIANEFAPSTAAFYDTLGEGLKSAGESAEKSGLINFLGSCLDIVTSLVPLLDLLGSALELLTPVFQVSAVSLGFLADAFTITTNAAAALVDIILHGVPALFGAGELHTDKYLDNIGDVFSGNDSALKRATDNIMNNASGNPNFQGGYTWIGENGPEKVWLPPGSQIQSAQESRMRSGDTFIFNVRMEEIQDLMALVERMKSARRRGRMGGL